ncbi:preprotein translocase subunit SecE [Viscerimonas tarda]
MKKIFNYIKDCYNELVYKVSWPTKAELSSSAIVVLIASLIMAIVLFGVDSLFEWALKLFYGLV